MTERTDSLKSEDFVKCATCRSMGMDSCCNFRSDHYGHKIEDFHPACTEYTSTTWEGKHETHKS